MKSLIRVHCNQLYMMSFAKLTVFESLYINEFSMDKAEIWSMYASISNLDGLKISC